MEQSGDSGSGSVERSGYGVLWDVDGVVIDSAEQHRLAWKQLAEENGFPYSDAAFWAGFGRRNSDVIPLMFGVEGPPERLAALAERKEQIYRTLVAEQGQALPGARELMAALHAAGYRQALASSAPEANIRLIVDLLGLGSYLGATVSGEAVAHGKPAPDIFLAAAERLDVAPGHCLVIEDAPAGVQAARAAGMRCLAIRRAGQADAPGLEAADALVTSLEEASVALVDRLLGLG
ncbi:MAG TPA: HAD family phosphatase [Ktedonobacterales bacterium]|nr:HAD family phosphatase [Ktedonobacterales bacterium]